MKIITLDRSFEVSGFISDYIAYEYSESYNEAGAFSLEVGFSERAMELLKPEGYVVFENSLFVINERTAENGKIIARGESFLSLFKNVILEKPTLFDGNPFANLTKMMKLAQFNTLTFEVYSGIWNGGEYNDMFPYDCSVYSQLISVSSLYRFGFKVHFVTSQRLVRVMMMAKNDKSLEASGNGVLISDRLGDYHFCSYENDISNYKNYAHVPYGFDVNDNYVYVDVDWRKKGEIMRGMTVNIPKVFTTGSLESALRYQGELALASHRKKRIYTVSLAKETDLITGDICTFESKKYGERCNTLVKEKRTRERNGAREVLFTLECEE